MKELLNRWIKRWTAGLLVIAMLSGVVPATYAVEGEQNLLLNSSDSTTAQSPDPEEQQFEKLTIEDTPEPTEISEETEADETVNQTEPTENAEDDEATEPVEETQSTMEEELLLEQDRLDQESLLMPNTFALFGVRGDGRALEAENLYTLTLEEAKRIADELADQASEDSPDTLTIDSSSNTITASGRRSLILLSNVNPALYQSYSIELSVLDNEVGSYDLTTDVSYTLANETESETEEKTVSYAFLGFGGDGCPFSTELKFAEGSEKEIEVKTAFFRNLSSTAAVASLNFNVSSQVSGPIFAGTVTDSSDAHTGTTEPPVQWNVTLKGDEPIGGIIGTMLGGNVNMTVTLDGWDVNSADSDVIGSGNLGFFCNTMQGGTLNAVLQGTGSITLKSSDGNAGGFVGQMENDATLNASIEVGASITGVVSDSGYAGGLVGSAQNPTITVPEGCIDLSGMSVTGGSAAGGVIGYCDLPGRTIDLDKYKISSDSSVIRLTSSGGSAGGVFGVLYNSGGTLKFSAQNAVSSEGNAAFYGGLIGEYTASELKDTLKIKHLTVNSKRPGGEGYGGVIGTLPDACYVEMSDLTVGTNPVNNEANLKIYGGLVAKVGEISAPVLNVGSVTITSNNVDISNDDITGRGGLVGYLVKGVLRLSGTTDLSGQVIKGAQAYAGQIVGRNDDGLVYALGSGNDNDANWKFIRSANAERRCSDIGNWGAVVRPGDQSQITMEGGLLTFDHDNHTVTVNNGNGSSIASATDFAAYALAFDISDAYGGEDALSFTSVGYELNLNDSIDLTGTGILGIGKDILGEKAFDGTFNGNNNTVKLDIGRTYGVAANKNEGCGQIYSKRRDSRDSHYVLALFPVTNGATIKKVTVDGQINVHVNNGAGEKRPLYAAGVVGIATGETDFVDVTSTVDITVDDGPLGGNRWEFYVLQSGILGQYMGEGELTFNNCTWNSTLTNRRPTRIDQNTQVRYYYNNVGGFVARLLGNSTVTVSNSELKGTISLTGSNLWDAWAGGLIAYSRREKQSHSDGNFSDAGTNSIIRISNLTASDTINTDSAQSTSGGLLGYEWRNTNVTFENDGLKVSGAALNAGTNAHFGGLVYKATGHWDATQPNSIVFLEPTETVSCTTISGKTSADNPSGLLVGNGCPYDGEALYLEVGTFGEIGAAYYIATGSVTLNSNDTAVEYFDELVGVTIKNMMGNDNGVVSLETDDGTVDQTQLNTYIGQLGEYKNSKSRYYYNLSNISQDGTTLTGPQQVVTWSASQFAAKNIRTTLYQQCEKHVTLTGEIDLSTWSYYPVTPLSTVTVNSPKLNFGYDTIKEKEQANRPLYDETYQHYLMQHGLLYNVGTNVTVQDTTLSGVVGNIGGSGALIYGTASGSRAANTVITLSLENVALNGLKVTSVGDYTPLLINKINEYVTLDVSGLGTDVRYTDVAATSLMGNVGTESAIKLNLTFSDIALDGRKTDGGTSVYNNGITEVSYHTTKTIFTHATLMESFQYSGNSTGVYNFKKGDQKVTYGVEIANTDTGRNMGRQYQYYDEGFVSDWATKQDAAPATTVEDVKRRYTETNFLRYVYRQEGWKAEGDQDRNYHELDINLKATDGLTEGCGTYGDPYVIRTPEQLTNLAKFFSEPSAVNGLKVTFNPYVLENKTQKIDDSFHYHTQNNALTADHATYTWDSTKWTVEAEEAATVPPYVQNNALAYLLNAYYKIEGSIEITDSTYQGLGTEDNPFSGVITDGTVKIAFTNNAIGKFGGLILYSQGSVVKGVTVDYSGATINVNNNLGEAAKQENNVFFGGVVGYCMGGDTILDNMTVKGLNTVSLTSATDGYDRMIAMGGYVGLVGGAKAAGDGNETTGGGVVFRDMSGRGNPFVGAMAEKSADGSVGYFFCNPFVGRVLDGYACYETTSPALSGHTLDNTDKNYTIPDIVPGTGDLAVTSRQDGGYEVRVTSAQGLWLLSAIVNSGAGAMNSDGWYNHQYCGVSGASGDVAAYNAGKPRTAKYDKIGKTGVTNDDLVDEAFWGGVNKKDKSRVSYLVRNYTSSSNDGYLAARIAGGESLPNITLEFDPEEINMKPYGNGFRGIGSSFANGEETWNRANPIQGRFLRIKDINPVEADKSRDYTTIRLGIDRHDYCENFYQNAWFASGAGLFIGFAYSDGCTVNYLTLTGQSKLTLYSIANVEEVFFIKKLNDSNDYGKQGEAPVGGFAGRTANSKGKLKFSNFRLEGLTVYGGHHAAGAIGMLEKTGGGKTDVTFKNWYVGKDSGGNPFSASKKTYDDGSSAGLLGWCYNGSVTIDGVGLDSKEWNVDGLTVNSVSSSAGSVVSAGLTGATNSCSITIRNVRATNLEVGGDKLRDAGGLSGSVDGTFTAENCRLEGLRVIPESGMVGGICSNAKGTTITNCHLVGEERTPILVSGGGLAGGLIGQANSDPFRISDCTLSYVNVFSSGNDPAGLAGKISLADNKVANVSNIAFSHVNIAANRDDKAQGLLTGYLNDKKILNVYNILADTCKVGWKKGNDISVKNLQDKVLETTKSTGLWIGGFGNTAQCTIVAAAVTGTISPQRDFWENNSRNITYADYPAETGDLRSSGYPHVDVKPDSGVKVYNSSDADSGIALTGNGAAYTTNDKGEHVGVPAQIYEEIVSDSVADRKYFNLRGANKQPTITLPQEYLTTYQTAEADATRVPKGTDFAIFTLPITAENPDELVWDYIAALTNVANGTAAKERADSVTVNTCTWSGDKFVKGDPESYVSIGGDNKSIILTPKTQNQEYDNHFNRFTLLDVKYQNPTNQNDYFHLYVPILIQKVLQVELGVKVLAGTDYHPDSYQSVTSHAAADFGEPVTALIEYNYDRTLNEWQASLDNGENLLWYYEKQFNLNKGGNNNLPAGTRLTLVDVKTGKAYYHTLSAGEQITSFDFSTMRDSSGESFTPQYICDWLNIQATQGTAEDCMYVQANSGDATVRVGESYYRLANEDEKNGDTPRYRLTIGENTVENIVNGTQTSGRLLNPERYFLTIQVNNSAVINNLIDYTTSALKGSEHAPAAEQKHKSGYAGRYVLYEGVQQSDFTIETIRLRNGDENDQQNDCVMTENDAIRVTLTSKLKLTAAGRKNYKNYAPADLKHQYIIDLRKIENGDMSKVSLDVEEISWTYEVGYCNSSNQFVPIGGTSGYSSDSADTLPISSSGAETIKLKDWMVEIARGQRAEVPDGVDELTIRAVVSLKYGENVNTIFPLQKKQGDGCYVHAESRVANTENQLSITSHVEAENDGKRYYCEATSYAALTFNTIDIYGGRENTLQQGINPDDYERVLINTEAVYDYSGIEPSIRANATKVQYTLQLFRKKVGEKGYDSTPLAIDQYLSWVKKDGEELTLTDHCMALEWSDDITDDETNCARVFIDFEPITGLNFESKPDHYYSNYKVRLTAQLLDSSEPNGAALLNTNDDDFVIYTNARIYQGIIRVSTEGSSE